jgi:hypothetical protein
MFFDVNVNVMDVVSELKRQRKPSRRKLPETGGADRRTFPQPRRIIMARHPTVVDVSHCSYKSKLKS